MFTQKDHDKAAMKHAIPEEVARLKNHPQKILLYNAAGGGGGSVINQVISSELEGSALAAGYLRVRQELPDVGSTYAARVYLVHPDLV